MNEKIKREEDRTQAITSANQFIEKIKDDMIKIDERIQSIQMKQHGYELLMTHIQSIESAENETMINIGEGIHVKAEFQKKKTLMINIGLGFYMEASLDEAKILCEKQINRLEVEIQRDIHELAKRKAHLTLTREGKEILMTELSEN